MLHLSPLYRIDQGCENVSVVTVLYAVFGFDRICFRFFGFGWFFYGFAFSNRPRCPLHHPLRKIFWWKNCLKKFKVWEKIDKEISILSFDSPWASRNLNSGWDIRFPSHPSPGKWWFCIRASMYVRVWKPMFCRWLCFLSHSLGSRSR